MRTCYRRELKKQNRSEKSGAGTDDIYVPSLWYYDQLTFLKDQEVQVEGTSSISDADEEGFVEIEDQPCTSTSSRNKIRQKQIKIDRNEILLKAVQHLEGSSKKEEDDGMVFGTNWATIFRKLDERQQIYANKAICEVLYQGQLGKLHESSWKAFDSPVINTPMSSLSPVYSSTPSPISTDDSSYQYETTAHSPIYRSQTFTNVLPRNTFLHQPQPKRQKIIPYQVPPTKIFQPTTAIYVPAHSPEETETRFEATELLPSEYNSVQDLFSDTEYC